MDRTVNMQFLQLPGDILVEISSFLLVKPTAFEISKVSKPFVMWDMPDLSDLHRVALTSRILRDVTQSLRFRYVCCTSWQSIRNIDTYLELHPDASGMVRYLWLRRPGFLETPNRLLIRSVLQRLHSLEAFQAAFRGYLDAPTLATLATSTDLRYVWLDCDLIQTDPIPAFAELRLTSLHLGILKLHHDSHRDVLPLHDILLGRTKHTLKYLELSCFSGGTIGTGELMLSQFLPKLLSLPALEALSLTGKIRVDVNVLATMSSDMPKLELLNSGTVIANAIDYFGKGTWTSLKRLHLGHFVSLGTSDDSIAHEQIISKASELCELRIGNISVPVALRVFGQEVCSSPLRHLRAITLYIQLIPQETEIEAQDFLRIFQGIPSVERLTILSASYGAPMYRKNWTIDIPSLVSALGKLRRLQEFELDPRLISDDADMLPNGDLADPATIAWRERHEQLYKSSTAAMASNCPSLRQVLWGLGFPFIVWRGIISSQSDSVEAEEPGIEMYLERRSRSGAS